MTSIFLTILVALGCFPSVYAINSSPQRLYIATQINNPTLKSIEPTAINDAGLVVGQADDQAFAWSDNPGLQTITLLGTLPKTSWQDGEGSRSEAEAVSNDGQIVGGNGGFQPFVMSGLYACYAFIGNIHSIRPLFTNKDTSNSNINDDRVKIPHEESFEAFGINSSGTIVGLDGYRGFIYSRGIEAEIKPISHYPEGNGTTCAAINDNGWFVGATTIEKQIDVEGGEDGNYVNGKYVSHREIDHTTIVHAFLCGGYYPKHRLIDLGTLKGFPYSTATAMNNKGDVVGYVGTSGFDKLASVTEDAHAFLWHKGRMTDLGTLPGAKSCRALGINDSGIVVGESGNHAVVWINGKIYDLNSLIKNPTKLELTEAVGINKKGQIVCVGESAYDPNDFSGVEKKTGWLLTPAL